jgi:hypothetical protein
MAEIVIRVDRVVKRFPSAEYKGGVLLCSEKRNRITAGERKRID